MKTRAILVFSALLALPVLADDVLPSPAAPAAGTAERKTVKKPAATPAAEAARLVVTKDAETGEIRPASAAEREKLLGRRPLVSAGHRVVRLPDGSLMAELGEEDLSYAVATRNADGTITQRCVHGAKAAAEAVPAPSAATPGAPAAPAAAGR